MRIVLMLTCAALCVAAVTASGVPQRSDAELADMWDLWKATHLKNYESSAHETVRFAHFKANVGRIDALSAEHIAKHGYSPFGLNQFADLEPVEFKQQRLGYRPDAAKMRDPHRPVLSPNLREFLAANGTVDWRTKGAITPVKDQGQCGSCWAFSATEGVESGNYLAGRPLVSLAPQQIVSCDTVDQGCNGGDLPTAWAYVQKAGGLETNANYPYFSGQSGDDGRCKFNSAKVKYTMTGYKYGTSPCYDSCDNQDEKTLRANVASHGPMSICVNAGVWQFYTGGVLASGCGGHGYYDLDHCVQLVGYNTNAQGQQYYMVRNSWASSWGEGGYIYIATGSNVCGIADEAAFVEA